MLRLQPASWTAAYVAEGLGTFGLVFAGCGAIMIDTLSHGAITHVGVSLVFGLVITVMIYAFGHLSGAHFNPAVTLAFVGTRHFPVRRLLEHQWRVLFLCTHNSSRSQIAEGLLRTHAGSTFKVFSAGTEPRIVHPLAITVMNEIGIDINHHQAKNLEQVSTAAKALEEPEV